MSGNKPCPVLGQFNLVSIASSRIDFWCAERVTKEVMSEMTNLVQGIEGIEFVFHVTENGATFALALDGKYDPDELRRVFVYAWLERSRSFTSDEIANLRQDSSGIKSALAVSADRSGFETH